MIQSLSHITVYCIAWMTWKKLTERDCGEWKLSAIDPHDRDTWRSGVRSAMHSASQLPGRGPTVVDIAPVPAR